jgi:hypothetical protein
VIVYSVGVRRGGVPKEYRDPHFLVEARTLLPHGGHLLRSSIAFIEKRVRGTEAEIASVEQDVIDTLRRQFAAHVLGV